MEGEEQLCVKCQRRIQNPRQCPYCHALYCQKCIEYCYLIEKNCYCLSCNNNPKLDEYIVRQDLASVFTYNDMRKFNQLDYSFCIECCRDFKENERNSHINHHFFNSNLIRKKNLLNFLKDFHKLIIFENTIEQNYLQCKKNKLLLDSIEKIKLDEIENFKKYILENFETKRKEFLELESSLKGIRDNYKEKINQNLRTIKNILDGNNEFSPQIYNKIDEYFNKIKRENEEITRNIQNINPLFNTIKFESYNEQKLDQMIINWDNHSINKSIYLNNLSNFKLYIYQSNKIQIRIDMKRQYLEDYNYDIHLLIYNNYRTLEISTKFEYNLENSDIVSYLGNYQDINNFNSLMGKGVECRFVISRYAIIN